VFQASVTIRLRAFSVSFFHDSISSINHQSRWFLLDRLRVPTTPAHLPSTISSIRKVTFLKAFFGGLLRVSFFRSADVTDYPRACMPLPYRFTDDHIDFFLYFICSKGQSITVARSEIFCFQLPLLRSTIAQHSNKVDYFLVYLHSLGILECYDVVKN
jgi:hypothetical protein